MVSFTFNISDLNIIYFITFIMFKDNKTQAVEKRIIFQAQVLKVFLVVLKLGS